MYIHLDGQPFYPNATPEHLQRGLATLNAVIGDLHANPLQSVLAEEWIAGHNQAMLDPLDGIFLYMFFLQPEPITLEDDFYWDPKPAWHMAMDWQPNLLQGYAIPDYMTHFVEDDLVQEEPRVLGECFFPSSVNRLVDSVSDSKYDPLSTSSMKGSRAPWFLILKLGTIVSWSQILSHLLICGKSTR
ncbi:hypothetical protein RHMOL_Rhmol01G0234200 [Rhododendron molle]|uniref:Uncharacterized protein n=1 Tax=Rhododendron molle TaxID=49168 RepID=A0ACC0Q811_RHOML|nr:hypothetical protein RHMOL_Rhmol01G0234200 [Rhododendron molle]